MGNERIKHKRTNSLVNGIGSVVKGIDEIGKEILTACCEYLKGRGVDQENISNLSKEITTLRKAHSFQPIVLKPALPIKGIRRLTIKKL